MKKLLLLSALLIFAFSSELYSQKYDARYKVDGEIEVNSTSKISLDISNLSEAFSKTGIHNLGNGEYVSIDIDPEAADIKFADYYYRAEESARWNIRDFMKGSEFNGYGYKETKASHQKVYGNGEVYALYKIYFKIFPKENNQNLIKRNITSSNKYYFDRGYDKIQSKDYYGAISDYTKAIEINPNDELSYYNRGFAKFSLKDYYGTIDDLTKAIELDPNYADAYFVRGNSKMALEDNYGAISDYTKAIELNPNYAKAYLNRGNSKSSLKDYNGAIIDYTKAIELNPNDAKAYNNRAYTKFKLKDYYGAISDYTKAIELDPKNPYFFDKRGSCFYYLNNFTKAKEDSSKAIELNNTFARAYANRAYHNYKLGLISDACSDISQANFLGYDWDQAQLDDLVEKTNCNPN